MRAGQPGVPARTKPRIVLFNLSHGGHHPYHLACLLRAWPQRSAQGELHLVVSDSAAAVHPELLELAREVGVEAHAARIPPDFATAERTVLMRERLNRTLARRYADALSASHLLFMYLDAVQLSLAADLRFDRPMALSGIYFRPSFHYGSLGSRPTARERGVSVRKQLVMRAVLRNPHLRTLFTLDPFAVPHLARWARHTECLFLPDPVWIPPATGSDPPLLSGIEPGRRRLVAFGVLDERKGVLEILAALEALPESEQRQLALVLAGRFAEAERASFLARLSAFERRSSVQPVASDAPIPEAEIQPLLSACDLALVTYRRHVGSSGVLLRAAAAGVPVLASDYGLVGATVREHRLGVALDARSPQAIGAAISAWLRDPAAVPFDPAAAERLAAANSADLFAETIFGRLLGDTPPER